jgi:poly(hydroxyalkanoate) granule-associated protein
MKKKLLKKKLPRKPAAATAAVPVIDSARDIWLAGLGAFSMAQQESGRILEQGSKLFDMLVAEGSKVEKKTRKDVEGAVDDLRNEVENRVAAMKQQAEVMRKQATDNWDKLEKIFESRVARAMAGMGIPSKEDVNGLAEKVERLAREVAELGVKPAAGKRKAATGAGAPGRKATKKKVSRAAPRKAPPKPAGQPGPAGA